MATARIPQVAFEFDKSVVAKLDVEHARSDGGAVLLKALDRPLGVMETVARSPRDRRQPGKVQHALLALVQQRIFGLVCGYDDCSDAARLADAPAQNVLLDRDPITGAALATQATLSRFANAVGSLALTYLGHALTALPCALPPGQGTRGSAEPRSASRL
jgi:hypothetical protein